MSPTPTSTALRGLLTAAGYQVVFRSGPHVECLIHRGAERWWGRGDCEDVAIDDALARMLPSHAARHLLKRALSQPTAPAAIAGVTPAPPVGAPAQASAASPAPVPLEAGPSAHAPPAAPPSPGGPPEPGLSAQAPPAASPRLPSPPAASPAPKPAPVRAPGVPATREAGAAALDALLAEVEGQLPTFARMAPERQRILMLLWICRARRVEEAFPGEHDMERRASAIARRLSDLAKTFWPGSVRALQLGARPGDVPELRTRNAAPPRTWGEAALVAERLVQEHLAEAKAEGLDPEGWVTATVEPPIKANPEKVFTEAMTTLDTVLATLAQSGKTVTADQPALDKLVGAARRLRWTRGRVKDHVAWGSAVGRLRKLIPSLKTGATRIREAIDPRAKPEAW